MSNKVICPYCHEEAELVGGEVIYPHRKDLYDLRFWRCAPCDAYVGCHKPNEKYGRDGTQPLGRLASAELRKAKSEAHEVFDLIWKNGHKERKEAYVWLSSKLNISVGDCHIGMFDLELCKQTVAICVEYFGNKNDNVVIYQQVESK